MTAMVQDDTVMKLEDAVTVLVDEMTKGTHTSPASFPPPLAAALLEVQIALSRRRTQNQTPGGRIVIGLSREHAANLYAELGQRPINDDWAREVWNALRRADG